MGHLSLYPGGQDNLDLLESLVMTTVDSDDSVVRSRYIVSTMLLLLSRDNYGASVLCPKGQDNLDPLESLVMTTVASNACCRKLLHFIYNICLIVSAQYGTSVSLSQGRPVGKPSND